MSEIKNNVTRQGIYLGKTTTGALECLPPGNILIVGQNGHGFETLMNSILCNHMYMGNPKEEKILLYHDWMSVSPEWGKGWEGCPIIGGVYGEKEDSKDMLSDFASGIGMLVADRVGFLGRDGVLPEDNNCHYTVFAVFTKNVRSLDDNPDFCKLMMCAHSCREDRNINIDFVIALEHHVPDINHVFNWVCCTPLGDDEFANVVMGNNYPARSPWSYGVVFYRQNHPGFPVSKLNVIYRPDTYIQKLLKSFRVKKPKQSDCVCYTNDSTVLLCKKEVCGGDIRVPLSNMAVVGNFKSGKTSVMRGILVSMLKENKYGEFDFRYISVHNDQWGSNLDGRCVKVNSISEFMSYISELYNAAINGTLARPTVVFIDQFTNKLASWLKDAMYSNAYWLSNIFDNCEKYGLYFVVATTHFKDKFYRKLGVDKFGIRIFTTCTKDCWPGREEQAALSTKEYKSAIGFDEYSVLINVDVKGAETGLTGRGFPGRKVEETSESTVLYEYYVWKGKE